MRLRTFILLIVVLILIAVVSVLAFTRFSGSSITDSLPGDTAEQPTTVESEAEPGVPPPTATAVVQYETVVVAARSIPIGERLREDLLLTELRPSSNIALQGGYTYSDPAELVGRVVKTNIVKGQEILAPMLALNPTDLASTGSDLALYVDQGRVAIAFPIDRYSGAAYAMRPGDNVDILMSLPIVELDPDFNTKLPNITQRVDELALAEGQDFLFPPALEGRLELVEPLNLVGEVSGPIGSNPSSLSTQVARRVTQLSIQQAQVIWVGTWRDPQELERQADQAAAQAALAAETSEVAVPTPTPLPIRFDARPDIVVLSMTAQDALSLKWSLERGLDIDLALRSPGDTTVFATNSVSLPMLVDNGALRIPEQSQYGISKSMYDMEWPVLDQEE